MTGSEQGERIAALEVQVEHLIEGQTKTNQKLDELLALRNKGIGVFWLMSMLTGTGIVGTFVALVEWFNKGH